MAFWDLPVRELAAGLSRVQMGERLLNATLAGVGVDPPLTVRGRLMISMCSFVDCDLSQLQWSWFLDCRIEETAGFVYRVGSRLPRGDVLEASKCRVVSHVALAGADRGPLEFERQEIDTRAVWVKPL